MQRLQLVPLKVFRCDMFFISRMVRIRFKNRYIAGILLFTNRIHCQYARFVTQGYFAHFGRIVYVLLKEKRILSSCVDDIRREFHHGADSYKRTILIRHITRLLDYTTRFYERQFIVRELNNELLIRQYEKLVKQYIGDGKLAQKPLTSAYCAGQLHLSEAYFNDLLELQLGHTHSCHLQLKRIEMAKEKLRSSGESLSQIVHELGFPSIQYFSFLFKKMTGITPNSYRSLN